MFYQIMATATYYRNKFSTTIQIPTFYLNGDLQGIVNKEHAESIAKSIIDASDDPNIEINVSVEEIKELKWN